jgi:hypothetical protein
MSASTERTKAAEKLMSETQDKRFPQRTVEDRNHWVANNEDNINGERTALERRIAKRRARN